MCDSEDGKRENSMEGAVRREQGGRRDNGCALINQIGKEIKETMRSYFWNELGALHSLVWLIKGMDQETEKEKAIIGQCLPLWEELRLKTKDWCAKFHVNENHAHKVFD